MGLLSFFGAGQAKLKNALRKGAIVIDVRTPQEYDQGHIPDAFNIPVDRINASAERLKASNLPVIVCCNTGARSKTAFEQLKARGLTNLYNGGNWRQVLQLISKL